MTGFPWIPWIVGLLLIRSYRWLFFTFCVVFLGNRDSLFYQNNLLWFMLTSFCLWLFKKMKTSHVTLLYNRVTFYVHFKIFCFYFEMSCKVLSLRYSWSYFYFKSLNLMTTFDFCRLKMECYLLQLKLLLKFLRGIMENKKRFILSSWRKRGDKNNLDFFFGCYYRWVAWVALSNQKRCLAFSMLSMQA